MNSNLRSHCPRNSRRRTFQIDAFSLYYLSDLWCTLSLSFTFRYIFIIGWFVRRTIYNKYKYDAITKFCLVIPLFKHITGSLSSIYYFAPTYIIVNTLSRHACAWQIFIVYIRFFLPILAQMLVHFKTLHNMNIFVSKKI